MKIVDVHIHRVTMPRDYRYIAKTPEEVQKVRPGVASRYFLYELVTDTGLRGIGEVSDVSARMKALSAPELRDLLTGVLSGLDPLRRRRAWEAVCEAIPAATHPEYRQLVAASLDMALLDLAGRHFGVPVYELLGGRYWDAIPVSWVSYLRGADMLEGEIEQKLREGFRNFKLKAGWSGFDLDYERVRTFRRVAGPGVHLRIDVSGEWEEEEAISNIRRLSGFGLDAVETPISAVARWKGNDNPELVDKNAEEVARALARVRAAVPCRIIEHVGDFSDAFPLALVKHRAVDIFNVIPAQSGGLTRTQRLIHLAEQAGVQVLFGSTVELGPGTAASLHLAQASKAVTVASDIVGPGFLVDDVTRSPLRYEEGSIRVSDAPGLGVALDPAKLKEYASKDNA